METPRSSCYRARVSTCRPCIVGFVAALLGTALSGTAHADVSSWLFAGSGPSAIDRTAQTRDVRAAMQLDAGLGLPPSYDVIPGLLFRMNTRFGEGSDVALLIRTATGGYARGNWGFAVDLGAYERWWGDAPAPGLAGTLSLGAPWGITVNLDYQQDSSTVRTYAAVVGLDFARFTIYRSTGLGWWSNPYPAPPASERAR